MAKKLPSLLEPLTALLARRPDGLSISDLVGEFNAMSQRTLQRRLDHWVKRGVFTTRGKGRAVRYLLAAPTAAIMPGTGNSSIEGRLPNVETIPVSILGKEIQALIRRPIADRQPVGYQRNFLQRYSANTTAYLSDALRAHLHALGRTPESQRAAGTYARDIFDRLLIDLSWSSSRLEGNTYSLLDTRELIERGTVAAGKDVKETQMILNHKAAIELLVESADEIGVNGYTIQNLHALLSDNLLDSPRNAGRLRETPVGIGESTYIPTAIPQLIREMFERLLKTAAAISDAFEQSFFLLVQIPYLQPFVDVNKRTSRLACNIPLIKRNLVPLSFIDVPKDIYIEGLIGVYEQNRVELLRDVFLWAYERSARRYKTVRDSLPEPDPFRLKYRSALTDAIGAVVRRHVAASRRAIVSFSRKLIQPNDVTAFVRLVLSELGDLHEGNIARYGLKPSEYRSWHATADPQAPRARNMAIGLRSQKVPTGGRQKK